MSPHMTHTHTIIIFFCSFKVLGEKEKSINWQKSERDWENCFLGGATMLSSVVWSGVFTWKRRICKYIKTKML